MSKAPDTSGAAVVLRNEDVAEIGKIREATPTVDRIAEDCGATVRTEVNQFGREEKVATVPFRAAFEAMRKPWEMDTERQSQLAAKRPMETLRDANGAEQKVWNIHAEEVARVKGMKPAWRAGGARLRTGPNGNLWREEGHDNWVDTGKRCLTRPWFGEDADDAPPSGGIVIH